ncbi:MAG: molybdopterin-dependent oxidoreductase [Deltaproteobacteria bacterium]|nr:molybdopterin-dependent oxidoreductase [Deltaproteobacteria bacterium]
MSKYNVVGKRVPKVDARAKVTGRALYADDIYMPGMLYGKIVRCWEYAHARVTELDVSEAKKMPGVVKILTPEDITKYPTYNTGVMDMFASDAANEAWGELAEQPIFATHVKHQGDAICGIVAKSEEEAERAADKIRVVYEPLPVYLTDEESKQPDAVQFHPDKPNNMAYKVPGVMFPEGYYGYGDVDKGLEEADLVYEEKYYVPKQKHCQMEPHCYIAVFDDKGRLEVWTSTQMPKPVHNKLSRIFGLPMTKVKVNQVVIGGAFGGRLGLVGEPFVCAMAMAVPGRPIKVNYTREEDWITSESRNPGFWKLKMGFKKDGTPVAYDGYFATLKGGYYTHAGVVLVAGLLSRAHYKWENWRYDGESYFTNQAPCGAFRGYGNPQQSFAMEQLIQRMCNETGIDPVEWRIKWHREAGEDIYGFGIPIQSCGATEALIKGADAFNWKEKKEKYAKQTGLKRRGVGMMLGVHASAGFPVLLEHTVAMVKLNEDATAVVNCSISDLGCGNHTAITQIAAETLGFPMEDVFLLAGDSDANAFDIGAHSSRTIWTAGLAVKEACEDAVRQMLEKAAKHLKVDPKDLEMKDKKIFVKDNPDQVVDLADMLWKGIYAFMDPETFQFPFERGQIIGKGDFMPFANNPAWYACFVEVEVDMETGEWKLIECCYVNDIGQAIHPPSVEGQLEGGIQQGIGYALTEEIYYDANGLCLNNSFTDYKMLGPSDMPKCDIHLLETPEPYGPYGGRGAGEGGLIGPVAAAANAISNAAGVQITHGPITPEKILKALKAKT